MNKRILGSLIVIFLLVASEKSYSMDLDGQEILDATALGTEKTEGKTTIINNYYGKSHPLRTAFKLACCGAIVVIGWRYGRPAITFVKDVCAAPARIKAMEAATKKGFADTDATLSSLHKKCSSIDGNVSEILRTGAKKADLYGLARSQELEKLATKEQVDALRDGIATTIPTKHDLTKALGPVAKTADVEKLAQMLASKEDVQTLARVLRSQAGVQTKIPDSFWERMVNAKQN